VGDIEREWLSFFLLKFGTAVTFRILRGFVPLMTIMDIYVLCHYELIDRCPHTFLAALNV